MCGHCLEPDLNKWTTQRHFGDNWKHFNIGTCLGDMKKLVTLLIMIMLVM